MPGLATMVPLAAVTVVQATFAGLALIALLSAAVVVLHRTPVVQGLFLAMHLISIAGLFALLGARFLAVLQILIYAGAVVVLIVFVIMLLNLKPEARGGPGIAMVSFSVLLGVLLVLLLARAAIGFDPPTEGGAMQLAAGYGSPEQIADALFEKYFYPFEVVSLALVAAMIGAVLLAKRHLEG